MPPDGGVLATKSFVLGDMGVEETFGVPDGGGLTGVPDGGGAGPSTNSSLDGNNTAPNGSGANPGEGVAGVTFGNFPLYAFIKRSTLLLKYAPVSTPL